VAENIRHFELFDQTFAIGGMFHRKILTPENLITLAHFSVYAPMNVRKSAGELANTV
jgi:hypothetical protein